MSCQEDEDRDLKNRINFLEKKVADHEALEAKHKETLHDLYVHQEELKVQNDDLVAAQREIEISAKKHHDLFDFAPVGYVLLNKNNVIENINFTFSKMLGKYKNSYIGKPLFLYVTPPFRELLASHLRKVWQHVEKTAVDEIEMIDHQKKIFSVSLESALVLDYDSGENHCQTAIIDITEKKQALEEKRKLQAQLFQSQKMETMGTLAGGIAHEFNNMLAIIMGNTELLMDEPTSRIEREFLQDIFHAAVKGKELVRQMLLFAHRHDSKHETLSLNELINKNYEMVKKLMPPAIEIKINLQDNLWLVMANANQLEQVLINLALNAGDAMPDGGVLTISADNAAVGEELRRRYPILEKDQYVRITISDTGTGIPEETRNQIFDPFFSTKEVGKGTGLGLSVVDGIVRSHNGAIFCESRLLKGTDFIIFLPAAKNIKHTIVKQAENIGESAESAGRKGITYVLNE